ncbi:MAG: sigma-54 dependent transcriptional regulator [Bryobacteraceae bacterium]|nr:sigma-54 dependent transcriptional regulator [Bryobacteraceae bacterium]
MTIEDQTRVLIGQSARTRQLLRLIEKLGPAQWPVLLMGETGTGKEVVARRLHSARAAGPFVTIDCSAMVGPLMESELFGHAKGAFTGAQNQKLGLVEAATGGTAFFDEIGELPLDLQSKLLRLLQEKEYRPVGSVAARKADFRVVAATNRDLAKEVEKGTFRRDLYYRLNVVTVRLAPLRERREDIPALVSHFLASHGTRHQLSTDALETLLAYDWPGNVRELENGVAHMVAVNSGPYITVRDLPTGVQNFAMQRGQPQARAAAAAAPGLLAPGLTVGHHAGHHAGAAPALAPMVEIHSHSAPAPRFNGPILRLAELERQHILRTLEYTRGDRITAASLLGIGRTTLYRKLKEYQARPGVL